MNDEEKKREAESFERKHKMRPHFRKLFAKAQRSLYRRDILQPHEEGFKTVYKNMHLIHEAADRKVERDARKRDKELDEAYRVSKGVLTLEQKILGDLHKENPRMVKEDDIIKWPTTARSTK